MENLANVNESYIIIVTNNKGCIRDPSLKLGGVTEHSSLTHNGDDQATSHQKR